MLENFALDKILRTALTNGGEYADIYYEGGDSTQVVFEDGKVEKVLAFSDRGVGIRVISDFRTAYGYTNDVTEKSLLELAARISTAVKGCSCPGWTQSVRPSCAFQTPLIFGDSWMWLVRSRGANLSSR